MTNNLLHIQSANSNWPKTRLENSAGNNWPEKSAGNNWPVKIVQKIVQKNGPEIIGR